MWVWLKEISKNKIMWQILAWSACPCILLKKSQKAGNPPHPPSPSFAGIKGLTFTARHPCCEQEIKGSISLHSAPPPPPLYEHIWIHHQLFPLKELNSVEFVSPHKVEWIFVISEGNKRAPTRAVVRKKLWPRQCPWKIMTEAMSMFKFSS